MQKTSSKLSVVIITFNEEKNIGRCLDALDSLADEIIIVDSNSTDKTVTIAKQYNCVVIQQAWLGYSAQKNLGNERASFDYILSLDADEVISPTLIKSIQDEKEKGFTGAYTFNRLTNYCGSWIKNSGWYPDVKLRIFPKKTTQWVGEFVHEELSFSSDIKVSHLTGDLLHYSYDSYQDHRARADKYSKLTAEKMHAAGRKAGLLKPYLSAFVRFIGMYFFKTGFLDGKAGFMIALISAQSNVYKYKTLQKLNRNEVV